MALLAGAASRPSERRLVRHLQEGDRKPRVEYDDAVEEALAFGWIDSKANTLDDERSLMWMSPRKPKSGWSKLNKERIARLERNGSMAPAGRAVVASAKKSGAWALLDKVEALEVPDDLRDALSGNPLANEFFDRFPPSAKKGILTWVASAKRDATRQKRIEETVRLAAENKRANQ